MTRRQCPLCGADRPEALGTLSARKICEGNDTYRSDALARLDVDPDVEYSFVRCVACDFIYALTAPDAPFLKRLYNDVIDGSIAQVESQRPGWVAHQLQLAATLLGCIQDGRSVKVLDYGCGYGVILRSLAGPALTCTGYEFSETVAAEVRQQGFDVVLSLDDVRLRAPFDGIVLSDVLEHVIHPRETLSVCRDLLRAGGWICVSVPDFSERRARSVFGALSRGEDVTREVNPWEHLNYFSPETLAKMLAGEGFAVDPYPTATFGLRPTNNSIVRWGNAVKSAARMLTFTARPNATSTFLVAQRI